MMALVRSVFLDWTKLAYVYKKQNVAEKKEKKKLTLDDIKLKIPETIENLKTFGRQLYSQKDATLSDLVIAANDVSRVQREVVPVAASVQAEDPAPSVPTLPQIVPVAVTIDDMSQKYERSGQNTSFDIEMITITFDREGDPASQMKKEKAQKIISDMRVQVASPGASLGEIFSKTKADPHILEIDQNFSDDGYKMFFDVQQNELINVDEQFSNSVLEAKPNSYEISTAYSFRDEAKKDSYESSISLFRVLKK